VLGLGIRVIDTKGAGAVACCKWAMEDVDSSK
jgi:hypothetical protein